MTEAPIAVLAVVAHADDETLGCGATLALHADRGDDVSVLVMTDGVGSRAESDAEAACERRKALDAAAAILGIRRVERLDFPDNAMDQIALLEIVRSIERFCTRWGWPDLVYTHHPGDLNIDHELTHRATMTAFRPQPGLQTREIRTFEVLSSTGWAGHARTTEFRPNIFVDISATLDRKMLALEAYASEMRAWPHARSRESALALAHSAGCQVGLAAAERFVLERLILRSPDPTPKAGHTLS